MAKKQIKFEIMTDGMIKFDNTGNPGDEAAILKELAELAEYLSGDPKAVKIEKHVHKHAHGVTHEHQHAGG